jgi:hypothetical protein
MMNDPPPALLNEFHPHAELMFEHLRCHRRGRRLSI